jgi:hypothetical protein
MGFEIHRLDEPEPREHEYWEADRRLYLTQDQERLVEHGDPDAYILFCTPGKRVPMRLAERYGLAEGSPEEGSEPDHPDYDDVTVEELKDQLRDADLPVSGTKLELYRRLEKHLAQTKRRTPEEDK